MPNPYLEDFIEKSSFFIHGFVREVFHEGKLVGSTPFLLEEMPEDVTLGSPGETKVTLIAETTFHRGSLKTTLPAGSVVTIRYDAVCGRRKMSIPTDPN